MSANYEPKAVTAAEQDHTDPWKYAGEEAAAPENVTTKDGDK